MTKLSIITAVFNRVDTIGMALQSVGSQTHANIEHIVIDGASIDGTLDVLMANQDGIDVLVSEPDHGLYDALNKGIALATGDVVGFLHADDFYAHEQVVAQVMDVMERESLDALFGDVAFFRPENLQHIVRRYRSEHFRPERIAWGWMPAHPTLFLRRTVFKRVGAFRTDYRIASDFEFVARAFGGNTLSYRYLPEILVHMRTGGISTGGWSNTLLLNREVLRACRENGISTNLLKILSKYPIKLLEYFHK